MTKFVTPFNNKNKKVTVPFMLPSLTDQSAVQEADIGFIIENFVKTGRLPEEKTPSFIDCTTVQDYETSMQLVAECKTQFELLPAKERSEFKTVSNWLNFINDPANLPTCVERGYLAESDVVRHTFETPPNSSTQKVSEIPVSQDNDTVVANS